jgi:hypothetical protein
MKFIETPDEVALHQFSSPLGFEGRSLWVTRMSLTGDMLRGTDKFYRLVLLIVPCGRYSLRRRRSEPALAPVHETRWLVRKRRTPGARRQPRTPQASPECPRTARTFFPNSGRIDAKNLSGAASPCAGHAEAAAGFDAVAIFISFGVGLFGSQRVVALPNCYSHGSLVGPLRVHTAFEAGRHVCPARAVINRFCENRISVRL